MTRHAPKWLTLLLLVLVAPVGVATLGAGSRVVTNGDIQARLRAGKFAEAEKLSRERLATVETETGAESMETADVLDLLSESMRQAGKGGQPEVGEICKRAVRIKENAVGKKAARYAASLYQLGCWYFVNGDYEHARPCLEQSLEIREASLGPNHPDVAASLFMVGALKSEMADHTGAKAYLERSLSIRSSADPDGPSVAESMNGLASVLVRMGDYAAAEPTYRDALRIWSKAWGPWHAKVGTGWNNLSTVLYAIGDYEGALSCKDKALKIRMRTLGPKHELVGWTRANMGMNLAALGRKSDARRQYREALDILATRFGDNSAEVGWTLKRLGDTYLEPGHYKEAVPILERALSDLRTGDDPDHPDVGEAMAALGAAHTALGDTAVGNELNRSALAILRRRLGDQHPEVGFTLTQHAEALRFAGAYPPALEEALQGEEVSREHLRLTCRTMPERAALAYAGSRPAGGRLALSILGSISQPDNESVVRAWDSLIRSRTLVLDEIASRMRSASEAKDPETKRLVTNLTSARRRLANLIVAGPGSDPMLYRTSLENARKSSEDAERAVGDRSSAFTRDAARALVGLRQVSSSIPVGAALVAFAEAGEGRGRMYVAFALKAGDSRPRFVRIASASRVDRAVADWLTAVNEAGQDPSHRGRGSRSAGDSLEAILWSPVAPDVAGCHRVFLVGDGAVLLINFGALPADRGEYLIERGPVFHYLSSERDLVRSGAEPSGAGLLALGDPAFDERAQTEITAHSRGVEAGSDKRDVWNGKALAGAHFERLPKTGLEVRDIARIWADPAHTVILTGSAANERAFKADAAGHRVLHLATHGFFLDETATFASVGRRGIGATAPDDVVRPPRALVANPIHLSGLALAGANERSKAIPDAEDGILTAEEIASLDLRGTEWAVLSACDTGKGQIQVGEGVLGLRRAFQSAGARTVIMSLWAVEDESAREWMKALYEARVRGRLDTADAVTQADLKVLRARRAQARSTDPFYWAAFVATGDWK
jgi:CHAT domain-containing protein/tetratricopeptide (TPR) repeat protein